MLNAIGRLISPRGSVPIALGMLLFYPGPGVAADPLSAPAASNGADASPAARESTRITRFELPEQGDIIGEPVVVRAREGDTLLDVGRRYGLGYEEIRLANPDVDTWLPGEGTEVKLPTRFILPQAPREGIVINIAEMRLYYYPEDGGWVETFPVSIGRMDWSTPLGETEITMLLENPAWYPPRSIRKQAELRGETMPFEVSPGPDNPLGSHAIMLDISGYLLHGTNRPWGIGMRVTHGCVRLYPDDISYLFDRLEVGTPVRIVDQAFKAGWSADGVLYLQSYPLAGEHADAAYRGKLRMAVDAVESALGDLQHRVDRRRLRDAIESQQGSLTRLSREGEESAMVVAPARER